MKTILTIVTGALLLTACRSTKKITTAVAPKDSTQVTMPDSRKDSLAFIAKTLSGLESRHIAFTTFSAKVDIDYRDDADKHYDVNAVIRMQKDSAIWISANAVLGIEAMRVLITKDSVKLLNKLDKVYTRRSIDYLREVTSLPLDLPTMQDLLMGNPVFFNSDKVSSYSLTTDGQVSLLSVGNFFKNLLVVSGADNTLQRSKLDDADMTRNRTADLTYTDYENKRGPLFASKRRMIIAEKKKLDIRLNFKQYDFNSEVSFPFSIPKNYAQN